MIPLVDLKAQYNRLREQLNSAAIRVLESGHYALGPEVAAFEAEFAAYCGTAGAVAVNSGTSALQMALVAEGIGAGDEVITVPFTFVATAAAIVYTGARPVFVDVEPQTLTMDVAALKNAITAKTKAIMPVHLYGQPADMEAILRVAEAHGLAVIEDASQAHGALYGERRAGSMGHYGAFSFYPSKNLGACGEGGIIVSSDVEKLRLLRALRDWGQQSKYNYVVRGFNHRMDNLQGALLRVKLAHLDEWTEARRNLAMEYRKGLHGLPVGLPMEMEGRRHVYHLFVIRSKQREALRAHLRACEIQSEVHYPIPVHLIDAWCGGAYQRGDFPVAEQAASEVLSLPLYPEMEPSALARVVGELQSFFEETGAEG